MTRNLPPLPFGPPFTPVEIAPSANGVYELQLRNGMASAGELLDGYMLICNYHGKPQRMPVAWLGTFVKGWRYVTTTPANVPTI